MKPQQKTSRTLALYETLTESALTSEAFWERRYKAMKTLSTGRPSAAMERYVAGRKPGRALELGCARGDDSIWLARRGWTVTGVDVSETALNIARTAAQAENVAHRTCFERHDLSQSFPDGVYDLVAALFLHSPIDFGRKQVLRQGAASVAPGGLLLIVGHGSRAPWSEASLDTIYPTAEDELSDLRLAQNAWRNVFVDSAEREAIGPDGQRAVVIDTLIAIERIVGEEQGANAS